MSSSSSIVSTSPVPASSGGSSAQLNRQRASPHQRVARRPLQLRLRPSSGLSPASTSTQEASSSSVAIGEPLASPYLKSGPPPPGLDPQPLPASPHRWQPPGSTGEPPHAEGGGIPCFSLGVKGQDGPSLSVPAGPSHCRCNPIAQCLFIISIHIIHFKFKFSLNF
jgi:hypothetical protein